MNGFTPFSSLAGGLLVGAAASLLLWGTERRAGVSGIVAGALAPRPGDWLWRVLFLIGLFAGGLLVGAFVPGAIVPPTAPWGVIALSGLLVGFGARLGGGCTSGHGICGLSRLSQRSLVAVLVFMLTAIVVVALQRGGGA